MKLQKRFAVISAAMLIVTVFAGLGACARHTGAFAGPFHRWHGPGGDMPGFMLKRLDSKVEELNLTPAQKIRYDEFRTSITTHVSGAKEERKKLRDVARAELAKESPDVDALNATMKKKIANMSVAMQNDMDLFVSFYSTLDKDQKQKVLTEIRKRMAARDTYREEE